MQETGEDLWHTVLDTNLTGAFLACRAVVPRMAAQGGGAIITIGSLHARRCLPETVAYATSKGGLVTLTLNLASARAGQGIRLNCVHPGWVLSEGEMAIRSVTPEQADQWAGEMGSKLPLGRMQTPRDIAHMVAFLASNDAAQITGQAIAVDGGMGVMRP